MRIIPTIDEADAIAAEHLDEAMDNMIYRLGLLRVRLPNIPKPEPITRRCREFKDEPLGDE